MSQQGEHNDDDIALVGEYALHLLDARDRLAFEKRLEADAPLRALLKDWEEGLVPLADEIRPIDPPAHVKAAIDKRLFGHEKQGSTLRSLFTERLRLLGAVLAIALAVVIGIQFLPQNDGPLYDAEIAAEDRTLVVEAVFDPESAEIEVHRVAGAAVSGRVLELWLIAEGAAAPVSLGVLPEAQIATLRLAEDLSGSMLGGTLAISDEPPGGSPTGAPTGAVLAVGLVEAS